MNQRFCKEKMYIRNTLPRSPQYCLNSTTITDDRMVRSVSDAAAAAAAYSDKHGTLVLYPHNTSAYS